jgi:hypothetical protein
MCHGIIARQKALKSAATWLPVNSRVRIKSMIIVMSPKIMAGKRMAKVGFTKNFEER